MNDYEQTREFYNSLFSGIPNVIVKGKTTPYTSLNGHMFSFLDASGNVSIRLKKEDKEEFINTFQASESVQHGKIMKEYVLVPNELLTNKSVLSSFLLKSLAYIYTLKPKGKKN